MRTLRIELRWPPSVRVIECEISVQAANALMLDPPPLLVAACAAKARAESARRGWQTRKEYAAEMARLDAAAKAYYDGLEQEQPQTATGVAAAVAQEWMICPAGERYCKGCDNAIPHKRDHLCIGAPGTCPNCVPCEAPKTEGSIK